MRAILLSPAAALLLAGCVNTAEIGREPALSPVVPYSGTAVPYPEYAISKAPRTAAERSSLWNDRQSRLFTDPRALESGDILTVTILMNDRAQLRNQSERRRNSSRDIGLSGSFSFDGGASAAGEGSAQIGGGTQSAGRGETQRSEDIRLRVAAIVMDVLPNGNLLIRGSQEVRVNAELRVLTIEGIVRPADIGASNTIAYDRIAEARISYGGRGRLTEVQQPPYGQQILDAVLPF